MRLRGSPPSSSAILTLVTIITLIMTPLSLLPRAAIGAESPPDSAAPPAPPAPVAVSEFLYDDLRDLIVRDELRIPGFGARPLSSFALARALERARAAADSAGHGPALAARASYARARSALAEPLAESGLDPGLMAPKTLLRFGDAGSRLTISAFARFRAEAAPGRGFVLTDSTRAGLRFSWIVWPGFHLFEELYVADVPRGREFADPLVADTDIIIFQDRAYAGLSTRYADFIFGRDRLAWGPSEPGGTGGLLLSTGSRPFTHLRFESTFLDGRVHAIVVNGALSQAEDRFIAFHRLEWQATRALRLAVAEGAAYQADFVEPLYLVGIIPYPLVGRLLERDNDDRDSDALVRNNVVWDVDVSYIPRSGVEIYGELLLDDLGTDTSDTPTRLGYQVGTAFATDFRGYPVTARGEWTRVWRYVYSVFYGADFIHEGTPLGYPHGPDSRVAHLDAAIEVRPGLQLGAIGERIEHGEDGLGVFWNPDDPTQAGVEASDFGGTVERQWRLLGTLRYRPAPYFELDLQLGGAWVRNANHAAEDVSGLSGRAVFAVTR
jgi:hypothetical protein